MRPTVPELIDKLITHGDADQIAAYLSQEGVSGFKKNASSCVIANYLQERTEVDHVSVMPGAMTLFSDNRPPIVQPGLISWIADEEGNYTAHEMTMPDELERLANSFDRGDYPELVYQEEL